MTNYRITILLRNSTLYFQPQCGSLSLAPMHFLPASAAASQLGETALATFGDCKPPGAVSWPANWKAFVEPTLQILGVADWDELLVGASEVCLDLEDDLIIFNPLRTTEEGFAPISTEKRIVIPSTSPPEAIV